MDSFAEICDLFQFPQFVTTVAQWIYDEFWSDKDEYSVDDLAGLLRDAVADDAVPMSLLAFCDGRPAGTINLIENDDVQRTHLRPWLAALLVLPEYRGRGIGSALVRTLQCRAAGLGIDRLYLGTDSPDFYRRLGAVVHEQVTDEFCIMSLETMTAPTVS